MVNKLAHIIIIILILISKSSAGQVEVHIANNDTLIRTITLIQNPFYDEIICKIDGAEFLEYSIYDQSGKKIRDGWFLGKVPIQYLAPGSYSLVINFNDKKIKKEFLKLKSESISYKQDEFDQ